MNLYEDKLLDDILDDPAIDPDAPDALYAIAHCYRDGRGCAPSQGNYRIYLQRAAAAGNAEAQKELDAFSQPAPAADPKPTAQDYNHMKLGRLQELADNNDVQAIMVMVQRCLQLKDARQARAYLDKAQEIVASGRSGCTDAELRKLFLTQAKVLANAPFNDAAASMDAYGRASECGSATADLYLAECYRLGRNCPQDENLATEYEKRAARDGDGSMKLRIALRFLMRGRRVDGCMMLEEAQEALKKGKTAEFCRELIDLVGKGATLQELQAAVARADAAGVTAAQETMEGIRQQQEAEAQAKREAARKAQQEAARLQAQKAAAEKARQEAAERARQAAELKAKQEAEAAARRAQREEEERIAREAAAKARREAEIREEREAAERAEREEKRKARRRRGGILGLLLVLVVFVGGFSLSQRLKDMKYADYEQVDPFATIDIRVSGTSPYGNLDFAQMSDDVFLQQCSYEVSRSSDLANGDVVTITAQAGDDLCDEYKKLLSRTAMTYTVEGLTYYITDFSQLTPELTTALQEYATTYMHHRYFEDEADYSSRNKNAVSDYIDAPYGVSKIWVVSVTTRAIFVLPPDEKNDEARIVILADVSGTCKKQSYDDPVDFAGCQAVTLYEMTTDGTEFLSVGSSETKFYDSLDAARFAYKRDVGVFDEIDF